jgi:hypothetical protein
VSSSFSDASRAAGLKAALPKAAADLAGLEPIEKIRSRWPLILGGLLTLLMIVALGRELYTSGLAGLTRAVPTNPLFYLIFGFAYVTPPTFDYLIFRRLWKIPIAGMAALHKKRIANEVLFGYSGEAYFYAWARQRTQMVAAPFGAVKDVTILSAIAGNTMTLLMILLVTVFPDRLPPVITGQMIAASAALMVLMCLPFLIFSKRVFSLSKPLLWWVFGMHFARLVTGVVLVVLAWHFAMPQVSMGIWVFFAAVRLLASRLPFAPNKEVVFASFALLLNGSGSSLTELMALFAALTLLCHIALIAAFSLHSLVRKFA